MILTDNRIMRDQTMGIRNVQHLLTKFINIVHLTIVRRPPTKKEFLMHILWKRIRKITGCLFIGNDKKLQRRKNIIAEHPFFSIFFYLIKSLKITVFCTSLFQLNLHNRQPVDQQGYVKPSLTLIIRFFLGNLINDFISGNTSADVLIGIQDQRHGT